MTDFIRKLNLLLRTSLPDLPLPTGDSPAEPVRLGKNVDREIAALNDRVRDAYAYEAQLKSRADQLQGEIFALDETADAAVAEGREELARYHIEQMKRAQARLEMTQADLREHQRVTAELVQRVAGLEEAVARARQAQAEDDARDARPSMEDALRSAREQSEREAPASSAVPPPRSAARSEDDLDQRIRRLSK
jgi:phage shock protein A